MRWAQETAQLGGEEQKGGGGAGGGERERALPTEAAAGAQVQRCLAGPEGEVGPTKLQGRGWGRAEREQGRSQKPGWCGNRARPPPPNRFSSLETDLGGWSWRPPPGAGRRLARPLSSLSLPCAVVQRGKSPQFSQRERGTMIIELAPPVCLGMKWGRYSHSGGVDGPLSLLFLLTGHHLSPPVSGGAVLGHALPQAAWGETWANGCPVLASVSSVVGGDTDVPHGCSEVNFGPRASTPTVIRAPPSIPAALQESQGRRLVWVPPKGSLSGTFWVLGDSPPAP